MSTDQTTEQIPVTDTPFEVIGAPWLDGQKLASYLNARRIPGVRFIPVRLKPNASVFKNEECGGLNIVITDRSNFRSVRTGIEVAVALHALYPAEWKVDSYSRLLVNADALEKLKRGASPEELMQSWSGPLENFQRIRARALIYQ